MHDGIYYFPIAHAVACASFRQQVGSIAHALHAACHKGLVVAGTDRLGGQHDRLQTRATHFIDGKGRKIVWQASMNGGLASRRLTDAGGDDVAHDNFVNGARCYARTTYSFFYHNSTELGCGKTCKVAKKFAGRRSCCSDDNGDMFCHYHVLLLRFHTIVETRVRSPLFLIPHCLRQFARVFLCEVRIWQPQAAKSAPHTSMDEPPPATRSPA